MSAGALGATAPPGTVGPARILTTMTDDIPTLINALNMLPVLCVNAALVVGCLVYMGILSWLAVWHCDGIYDCRYSLIPTSHYQSTEDIPQCTQEGRGTSRPSACSDQWDQGTENSLCKARGVSEGLSRCDCNFIEAKQYFCIADVFCGGKLGVLVFIVIGLCLFVFPMMNHFHFPKSTLIGFTLALLYLMNPLQVIMNTLPQLGRATVALQALTQMGFKLAAVKPEDSVLTAPPLTHWKQLELRAVTHTYNVENETRSFVVGPIDLVFEHGELVFITGGNGSGKTTLIKLITGLYLPEQGHIYLDGTQIKDQTISGPRALLCGVFGLLLI